MEIAFLIVVIFLFLLAVFDLSVGVGNDAVNFLNSAIGSKAASFKRVLLVASAGVFIGAAMSNGMMDIARHGIFRPEHFSFYELMCIFMAVMVTDIILLDIFNSLGMPTSTTVSMVFELLGASFIVALFKMSGGIELGLNDLLNTEKALSVILGIFLSVAIAFVFGTLVQFLTRMIFTFEYRSRLKWKIGIFGGLCSTAIVYFLLIKGTANLTFMTDAVKTWIADNTALIVLSCFVFFALLMQLLHLLKVNVLKVIVLFGTFSLAMAFAGNDLVNFVGVPLSGLASFQDYIANGGGDAYGFTMGSLAAPSETPVYYLIGAGLIMVVSLTTSGKVRNVTNTAIGLSSQQAGDEMFGSSRIARRLVRWSMSALTFVRNHTPMPLRRWFNSRFDTDKSIIEQGAAFDLLRASINLVLAGVLIAIGTSLKLPLSTTFVTFMVAMGTSLADRAWGRESAVFRVTGVISVIGGWFITAGAAFIGAGLIVALMYVGGQWAMLALAVLTLGLIIRNNLRFNKRKNANDGDVLFQTILTTNDKDKLWPLMLLYINEQQGQFMQFARDRFSEISNAFATDNAAMLAKNESALLRNKAVLKNARRKETICLRMLPKDTAIEKSTWFYLSNNCCMGMLYNLLRINEVCKEHVDNNFLPLPSKFHSRYESLRRNVVAVFDSTLVLLESGDTDVAAPLRCECDKLKDQISATYHSAQRQLRDCDQSEMSVLYVYINVLQEMQELVSGIRKYARAYAKLINPGFTSRG